MPPTLFSLALLVVAGIGVSVWALLDLLRRPSSQWTAADEDKMVWVFVVVVVAFVGPLLYLGVGRKNLSEVPTARIAELVS